MMTWIGPAATEQANGTMGLFRAISKLFERRRTLGRMRDEDAEELLRRNPATAYYDAHRLAARARFSGDGEAFMHWARVAADIAKRSDCPMDLAAVKKIVDEEARRAKDSART